MTRPIKTITTAQLEYALTKVICELTGADYTVTVTELSFNDRRPVEHLDIAWANLLIRATNQGSRGA